MKKVILIIVIMIAAGSLYGQQGPGALAAQAQLQADAALKQAAHDCLTLLNAKDLASVDCILSESWLMAPNTRATRGGSLNRPSPFAAALANRSIGWATDYVSASGSQGVSWGIYLSRSTGDVGKYVAVWKKDKDGKWKLWLLSFNSDLPVQ